MWRSAVERTEPVVREILQYEGAPLHFFGVSPFRYTASTYGAYTLCADTRKLVFAYAPDLVFLPGSKHYAGVHVRVQAESKIKRSRDIPPYPALIPSPKASSSSPRKRSSNKTPATRQTRAKKAPTPSPPVVDDDSDAEVDDELPDVASDLIIATEVRQAEASLDDTVLVAYAKRKPFLACDEEGQEGTVTVTIVKGPNWKPHYCVTASAWCTGNIFVLGSESSFNKAQTAVFEFSFDLRVAPDYLDAHSQAAATATKFTQTRKCILGYVHVNIEVLKIKDACAGVDLSSIMRSCYKCVLKIPVRRAPVLYTQKLRSGWGQDLAIVYFDGGYVVRKNPWEAFIQPDNYPDVLEKIIDNVMEYKLL